MSATEILGFVTGAASVWLAVRENVWNWPIGIANSCFFLVLFWTSRLYANAFLQVLYIVLGLYGWRRWVRGGVHGAPLRVRRTWFVWIAADLIYIPLYAFTRLYLTSVVYALFLVMCIAGLVQWRRAVTGSTLAVDSIE